MRLRPMHRRSTVFPQTLRDGVRQAGKDSSGMRDGVTTQERDRLKALERESLALRQASESLRKGEDQPAIGPRAIRTLVLHGRRDCTLKR